MRYFERFNFTNHFIVILILKNMQFYKFYITEYNV